MHELKVDAAGHRVNSGKHLDSHIVLYVIYTILHHVLPIMSSVVVDMKQNPFVKISSD